MPLASARGHPLSHAVAVAMNCALAMRANGPLRLTSSSKVPLSTMRPPSKTTIRVAPRIVESRCAMTTVVRPRLLEGVLDPRFRPGIEGRRCLVENEDWGILE